MFNFFKKDKKHLIIGCHTDKVIIDAKQLTFPTDFNTLKEIFGKPSRKLEKSKNYVFWDSLGIFCAYTSPKEILSISIYQNKKDRSEYNTKRQFNGGLFLNDENITHKEFDKISLGEIAIIRLGSESESRYGFTIGANKDYKDLL